jgi:solute carrier family 45 protein 1/2/4
MLTKVYRFTWGLEMTYCTPYLLRLGLTKSMVSLVWIAGPLSGLIMHPIIGIIADRSTHPWGRRRPFMLVGTMLVCISLWLLGWTTEIVGVFVKDEGRRKGTVVAMAVLAIYGVDFAINIVQACCRSLIVDSLPTPKQQLGSAWASRMVAIGSLVGYGFGALDLGKIFGTTIGDTQFKQLVVVAGITLCTTVGLTCWAVSERVLVTNGKNEEGEGGGGAMEMFQQIYDAARNPPENIAAICSVQFWCWIGWVCGLSPFPKRSHVVQKKANMAPVSLPLLQHNLDRRSIHPLQRTRRRKRSS